MKSPLKSLYITSCFGYRTHPVTGEKQSFHNGTDYKATVGTALYSILDGVVVVSKVNNGGTKYGLGYYYVIDHGWFQSEYYHLNGLELKVGEHVTEGQKIGETGATGAITGAHLHFGIRIGEYNPTTYWVKNSTGQYLNSVDSDKFLKGVLALDELTWEEIVHITMDSPEQWIKGLDAFKEMAELSCDFGDIEIAKYFPEYTVKIAKKFYELGLKGK